MVAHRRRRPKPRSLSFPAKAARRSSSKSATTTTSPTRPAARHRRHRRAHRLRRLRHRGARVSTGTTTKASTSKAKSLLMLVNEPPSDDPKFFDGKALTYYGRWTYKYEEAARKGAVGALIIHRTDLASYGWDVVRNSNSGEKTLILTRRQGPRIEAARWIQLDVAATIAANLRPRPRQDDRQPRTRGLQSQCELARHASRPTSSAGPPLQSPTTWSHAARLRPAS